MSRKTGRAGAERKLLLQHETLTNKTHKTPADLVRIKELEAELKVLGYTVGLSGFTEIRLVNDPRRKIG